jgi:hypothetical protein
MQMGVLNRIAGEIKTRGGQNDQDDLERTLGQLYEAEGRRVRIRRVILCLARKPSR